MFDPSDIKPATVQEMVDTLRYLKREFDRYQHLDATNVRHIRAALAMVEHDQAAALYAKVSSGPDTHAATTGE